MPALYTYYLLFLVQQDSEDDDLQGSHGVRRRQPIQKIEPGSRNILSAKYEVSAKLIL